MTEPVANQQTSDTERDNRAGNAGMTLRDLLTIMRKHIATILVTFVVVLGAAIGYTFVAPVKYSATAQLFAVYDGKSGNENVADQSTGSSYIMSQIKSYPALAATSSVLQPVINELGLPVTSSELAKRIDVTNPTDTAFVNITATADSPYGSAQLANAVAKSLSNVVANSLYAAGSKSSVKLAVVQPASRPNSPSSPKWVLNISLGVVAGLVLGVLAALLKNALTKKIQDDDEIEDYISAPIIGRIAEDKILDGTAPAVVSEPGSPVAEDFRRIRTNLSFIVPTEGTNCRVIAVTSTGAGEGKTTMTVNIAAALAENGSRVLLVDADLRHPSVAHKLDIDGTAGLAHVLSGQASVDDVIQPYWKANLHIIPAGPKPPNASALLNSSAMETLLKNAQQQYDYVIIDTAPMIVANDAAVFTRQGASLVMVCRLGQALKRDLREIVEELSSLDISAAGVIANNIRKNKKELEHSNYYYYYSSDEHKKNAHKKRHHSAKDAQQSARPAMDGPDYVLRPPFPARYQGSHLSRH